MRWSTAFDEDDARRYGTHCDCGAHTHDVYLPILPRYIDTHTHTHFLSPRLKVKSMTSPVCVFSSPRILTIIIIEILDSFEVVAIVRSVLC